MSDIDKAKLLSCMEEVRNIIGDSSSDKRIAEAILINEYDMTKALDTILNSDNSSKAAQTTKKPKVLEVEKGMYDESY